MARPTFDNTVKIFEELVHTKAYRALDRNEKVTYITNILEQHLNYEKRLQFIAHLDKSNKIDLSDKNEIKRLVREEAWKKGYDTQCKHMKGIEI